MKPEPLSPHSAVEQARELRHRGSWSQAIAILEEVNQKYPDNQTINTELKRLKRAWSQEKRFIEDSMLVSEIASTREKIPLLEKLSEGEPNNVLYRSRLLFWQKYLQARADSLVACGIYHSKTNLNLAELCLTLANQIAPSEETKKLLSDISQSIEKRKHASTNRKAVQDARKRKRESLSLLAEAKRANLRGAHRDALIKLDEALRQDPKNAEARRLRIETQTALEQKVESLLRLGDRLYSEEQIVHAVAVWESALELDPEKQEIGERIDRARRVLGKLEAIRSRE